MAMSGLEFLILPPLIPKGTYCPVWLPSQSRKVFKVISPLNLISRVVGLCLDTQPTFPVSYRQALSYEAFPATPFPLLFCFSKENRIQKHHWSCCWLPSFCLRISETHALTQVLLTPQAWSSPALYFIPLTMKSLESFESIFSKNNIYRTSITCVVLTPADPVTANYPLVLEELPRERSHSLS